MLTYIFRARKHKIMRIILFSKPRYTIIMPTIYYCKMSSWLFKSSRICQLKIIFHLPPLSSPDFLPRKYKTMEICLNGSCSSEKEFFPSHWEMSQSPSRGCHGAFVKLQKNNWEEHTGIKHCWSHESLLQLQCHWNGCVVASGGKVKIFQQNYIHVKKWGGRVEIPSSKWGWEKSQMAEWCLVYKFHLNLYLQLKNIHYFLFHSCHSFILFSWTIFIHFSWTILYWIPIKSTIRICMVQLVRKEKIYTKLCILASVCTAWKPEITQNQRGWWLRFSNANQYFLVISLWMPN